MPYWLETDQFADDQVWDALAGGNADRRDRLQAAYCRLKAKASHLLTDGYLTEDTALRYARGSRDVLDRLTQSVLGRPPRVHRPGDQCDCLGESWVDGYAYRIHGFLRRNPARSEYRRNRRQQAELRDWRLRHAAYQRDGGCCRYCRSGPLSPKASRARDRRKVLMFDHVDPDQPAGPDAENFVTACGRCNEHKGRRTPYEADMVLLAPPSVVQRARWLTEELILIDPDQQQHQRRINDESTTRSTTNQRNVVDPVVDSVVDPDPPPGRHADDNSAGPVRPHNGADTPDQQQKRPGEGPGMGRVGKPNPDRPESARHPPRPPEHPDVYTRRSRPPDPCPEPPFAWPPGSVPADPPEMP